MKYAKKMNKVASECMIKNFKNNIDEIKSIKPIPNELFEKINWKEISRTPLSKEFIEKFADFLDWNLVSIYSTLSEEMIEKYIDRVNFIAISIHQFLSEEFLLKYRNKFDWEIVLGNQDLSSDFIKSHRELFNKEEKINNE